jgi:ribosomal protein L40E
MIASPASEKKICSSCGDLIPKKAAVCRQCRNYQGLWWGFRLIGLGLPWLIAAASLSTFGLGYWQAIHATQILNVVRSDDHEVTLAVSNRGSTSIVVSTELARGIWTER